jgi:hypothetical protein
MPAAPLERHPLDGSALRLAGSGDGSVQAYCGTCQELLPSLPRGRALTFAVLEERWRVHLRELPD